MEIHLLVKAPRRSLIALLLLSACGHSGGPTQIRTDADDTAAVQAMVNAGGVVKFEPRTYVLTKTIVVRKSYTILQGAGPLTVIEFRPALPQVQCVNDRAFTTPCDLVGVRRRQITAPIAIGDVSFQVIDDASDLQPDDWLIITEKDRTIGDVVLTDWVQVQSVTGKIVQIKAPFRTAFEQARSWDPDFSGLGYRKLPRLTQGVEFHDFNIVVPNSGENAPGISVFAALNTVINDVHVTNANGQALYSYLSKGLAIRNSSADSGLGLSEFASTTDLELTGNSFSSNANSGIGLDLGTGFFTVKGNLVPVSHDVGLYLLYGVHDGEVSGNQISLVPSAGNSIGILARGTQNVAIIDNFLAGGIGPRSFGISIGRQYIGEKPIPSTNNKIAPNQFGPSWTFDYDPTNQP